MKFKPVQLYMEIPQAHLDELGPLVDGHFCIASRCLTHPEYYEWYANRPKGLKVMLDNGTHEDREPLPSKQLLEVAKRLQPDLVFAPDILCDMQATLSRSYEFYEMAYLAGYDGAIGFVPQGKDNNDLVECYYDFANFLESNHPRGTIGLSLMDNREQFIESLLQEEGLRDVKHHMLGLRNLEEIYDWPAEILSMDTVKPIKAAYHGILMEDCPRGLGVWDTGWKLTESQLSLSRRNIHTLKTHLRRKPCQEL